MADNARRARWVRCSGPILAVILSCSVLHGQTPGAPSATQPTADADARTAAALKEAVSTATTDAPAATLMVSNREIVVLRATILLRTPATRTASASQLISSIIGQGMPRIVAARPLAGGQVITIGQQDVFALVPADLDPFGTETLEDVARATVGRLQLAYDEGIELRTPRRLFRAGVLSLLATLVLIVLLRLVIRFHFALGGAAKRAADRQLQRLPVGFLVRESRLQEYFPYLVSLVSISAGLALLYFWLTFVLRQFPYTRPWGETLRSFLLQRLAVMASNFLGAMPNLFSVLVIVAFTWLAVKLLRAIFRGVEEGRATLPGIYPETAQPTRRLATAFLWLFALAMAYPYLPGSNSDAFRGVSVFVGLMISLGSSGIVNQLMSGLTITFSRALRVGDYVRIGNVEGAVTHVGPLSTKLKTPRREEVTIPNAVVVATQTTNYSRHAGDEGVYAATSVTIGYDAPWRQVKALLLLATERTPGIRSDPQPVVRQTALQDFYVEYTLLVSLEDQASRVPTLDALHGNIQDAFNEHGVQIMSPHYEADPEAPKIAPRERWFTEPALPSDDR